ncbi:Aminomethyltransferase [Pseudovibrio sp. Ad46]|jgi:aminomethyltransferase|uniref:glycine cleavage system aminomethyltransferase GcvT n=1 Tax=Pseudovibrio TaxID=258255 RepID=UPI0007AE665B|nr:MULTISPECIES: glycine cleavage system aminomethyltransferase GcvT [Pseudovibrio]KZK90143.1 Aminomethyltransferase [Pseudovibrio sp. Ad5]KZK91440.1 Aminomethyltransferase [Pseudovibrio sp. Ad46]KZK94115.1 Aminomethyltransferase [Pseudovibrio sp. W74]KZL10029.1 Aminomethyltransferase [Pseudovibrio sp. Ad14]
MAEAADLLKTPLFDLHVELGAKMVPFAGYDMPVQFPLGVMKEHLFTRESAGLFDVSHMGQAWLVGPDHATTAAALETLVPSNMKELKPGKQRYTVLLNDNGCIIDDLMVSRPLASEDDGRLMLVVNAACKDNDYKIIAAALPENVKLEIVEDRALIAIQGPKAAEVMALHAPEAAEMGFMEARPLEFDGISVIASRSGYTGEDGYEISIPAGAAEAVAKALLADERVESIGLGARDSLRLEAGLCLYGHDIDENTTPVEGNITFCMQKRRKEAGDFPGGERVLKQLAEGTENLRVGLLLEGRAPAREGAEIRVPGTEEIIGRVTSGGYGPTLGAPVAMGYVPSNLAEIGTELELVVRGRALPAKVAEMPFVAQRYYRKPK